MAENPFRRSSRDGGGRAGGQPITQPGDPDFSPSEGTQVQPSAAAADKVRLENQRTARRHMERAARAGYDINNEDWDQVREQAETGIMEKSLGTIGSLLGWLDGPRQMINLAIQDISGGDADTDAGYRNPNFGDYWDALWGGMDDPDFQNETGLNPVSGSQTLEMFGWEEQEGLGGRLLRGVADFGLQVAIDPLTYVTFGFGAIAKKAAIEAGESLVRQSTKNIVASAAGTLKDDALKPFEKIARAAVYDEGGAQALRRQFKLAQAQNGGQLPEHLAEVTRRQFGTDDITQLSDEMFAELALFQHYHDNLMRPLARKDFAAIPKELRDELPGFLRGGARIAPPIGPKGILGGVQIPGTVGLGRKTVGDPLRKMSQGLKDLGVPGYEKLTTAMRNGVEAFSTSAPLINGLKEEGAGALEGWQYMLFQGAQDNMWNNVQKHQISTTLNAQWNHLDELAQAADVELADIGADVLYRLEGGTGDEALLKQLEEVMGLDPENLTGIRDAIYANPELDTAVQATVDYMQATMKSYHGALGALDPEFVNKFIRGYIPHVAVDPARELAEALIKAGVDIPAVDAASEMASQYLNALGRGGMAEDQLGATRYIDRKVGRVQALQFIDDGVIMLDQEALGVLKSEQVSKGFISPSTGKMIDEAAETKFITTPQLNQSIGPVLEAAAKKHGISLPKGWTGQVYNENPIEVMLQYVDNMTDTIQAWQTMDAMKGAGLTRQHMSRIDTQSTIQNMYNNIHDISRRTSHVKSGKPTPGEMDLAPTKWVDSIADPDNVQLAKQDLRGETFVREFDPETGAAIPPVEEAYADLANDIAEHGIQNPLIVAIDADGVPFLLDGHHRLEAAKQIGLEEVPVQFRREGVLEPAPGLSQNNVTRQLKPDWYGPKTDLYQEITNDPEAFVFAGRQGLSEDEVQRILSGETPVTRTGLTHDTRRAEGFARRTAADQGTREAATDVPGRVFVYRRDDLPEIVQRRLSEVREGGRLTDVEQIADLGEDIVVKPEAAYIADDGIESLSRPLDDMTSYDAYEVFNELPWGKQIKKQSLMETNVADRIPGVPNRIAKDLSDKGVPIKDIEEFADVATLANTLKTSTVDNFTEQVPMPRPNQFDQTHMNLYGDAATKRGWHETETGFQVLSNGRTATAAVNFGLDGQLRISINPKLTAMDRDVARDQVLDLLNAHFKRGEFKGKFNQKGMAEIVGDGLDAETARHLKDFFDIKMSTFSDATLELLGKEPAEIMRTRGLWDSFVESLNDFARDYGAYRTADGELVFDGKPGSIAGGDDVARRIRALEQAAEKAGEAGYDNAVQIMREVTEYTGTAEVPGFLNPGIYNISGPAVEGFHMQRDMAKWLSLQARNLALINTPAGVAAAKLAVNESLKWWRAMTTLPRAGFHIRNLIGGSWANMTGGVTTKSMRRVSVNGIRFRNALQRATLEAAEDSSVDIIESAIRKLPKGERAAWRAAWEENIFAGFATTEFTSALDPATRKGRLAWANVADVDNFVLTRAGARVMESVEDFLRMSMFIEYFDEAVEGSAKHARNMVNNFHFDYSDLSPSESITKSLIPFFVWQRNNLPLQIRTAIENPRMVQRYMAMMRAMNENFGDDDPGNLPEGEHYSAYTAGTNYKVNAGTPFESRIMISPDLPVNDLLDLPDPNFGDVAGWVNDLLGPHVSTLVDINHQREFDDVNAPRPLAGVLQTLAAVGFYDRSADGDVRIPYYMRTLQETALPWAKDVFDPALGGSNDPRRQQKAGITPDDGYAEGALKTLAAQVLSGMGVTLSTPADARSRAYASDAELDSIIKDLRLRGLAPLPER